MTLPATCSQCSRPAKARGLCPTHYQQQRRGSTPRPEVVMVVLPGLALRVSQATRDRLLTRASAAHRTVSEVVREILDRHA